MKKLPLYFILQLLFAISIHAQQSGDIDTTFGKPVLLLDDSSRFNGGMMKLIIQPDGFVLAGGSFTLYNNDTFPYIMRLDLADLPDTSFHPGLFDGTISDMILQPDNKIVVCGSFDTHDNDTSSGILRLNPDGSTDYSFAFNTTPNLNATSLAIQTDGKILLGGHFSFYSGDSALNLVRLNTDGTIDTAFANTIGTGFDNWVQSVIVQPDGKIVVAGRFTMFNGTPADRIVRLNNDGTLDQGFYIYPAFDEMILTLTIQSDGKIIAGGDFENYNSISQRRLCRLNTDGTRDTTFDVGTGFNDMIFELCIQPDGKVLVGGRYFLVDSTYYRDCLIRLNTDGSYDQTFYSGAGTSNTVHSICLYSNGFILVGGDYITVNNVTRRKIARLNPDGVLDGSLSCDKDFSDFVTETFIQPDGKIIVCGDFSKYHGYGVNRFIRLYPDGSIDTAMHTTLNQSAIDIAIDPAINKMYIVGNFTACKTKIHKYIVRIFMDGEIDTTFHHGYAFDQSTKAIVVQPDGKIIVGGVFLYYDSTNVNRIVRLLSDGSIDPTFFMGTGFNGEVKDLVLQSDGKIVVVGNFTSYNSNAIQNIVRLNTDGSIDTSFHCNVGLNGVGYSLALQQDGKILVGGMFTNYNGDYSPRLTRINTDGSPDLTFLSGAAFSNGVVNEIIIQPDGKILVAGDFLSYDNHSSPHLVRINTDGTYDNTLVTGTGFNSKLRTISLQSDGKVICGGEFTKYQQYFIDYLCRLEAAVPVSVSEMPVSEFQLYPNPSAGNFSIRLNETISLPATLSITNLVGQELKRIKLFNVNNSISIDQPAGIYLMRISDGKNEFSRKVIVAY